MTFHIGNLVIQITYKSTSNKALKRHLRKWASVNNLSAGLGAKLPLVRELRDYVKEYNLLDAKKEVEIMFGCNCEYLYSDKGRIKK